MDELKKYKKYNLRAGSLLESVIAITIIATCLLIGIRLYILVLNASHSKDDLAVKFVVNQLHIRMQQTMDFDTEVFSYQTYSIQKTVSRYEGVQGLHKIKYSVQTKQDTTVYVYLVRDTLHRR